MKVICSVGTDNQNIFISMLFSCCLDAKLCPSFLQPQTVARQAPLSMGFSRQAYESGFPFPSPGDFAYPGIKPTFSGIAGRLFTTEPPPIRGNGKKHVKPTKRDLSHQLEGTEGAVNESQKVLEITCIEPHGVRPGSPHQ